MNILSGKFEQNPLILLRKSCLKCDNICDKIVNIKEVKKLSVNNKIFTNEMKIIIGIKVWNIALYLKIENECNDSSFRCMKGHTNKQLKIKYIYI